MVQERKEIIINEIRHWKETKLLPAQYCDFLLALYLEGEDSSVQVNRSFSIPIKAVISFICSKFLFVLTFLVIYFTDFSFLMQIAFVIF